MFFLYFIYALSSSSVDKPQSIADAGSAQSECNEVLNKTV